MRAPRHLLLQALVLLVGLSAASADPVLPVTQGVRQSGQWAVSHISGALHIAGIARPVDVNCLSGCSGGGASGATQQGPAGQERWPTAAHQAGAWTVTANAGSGTFAVNGAVSQSGEWRLAHVSSVLHVQAAGPLPVTCLSGCGGGSGGGVDQSGLWSIQAHQAGTWAVTATQSGAWTATQTGEWTIRHIGSALHIAGTVNVNCVSGCAGGGASPVSHITSVTHVAGVVAGFGKQATDVVDTSNAALRVNVVVGGSTPSEPATFSCVFDRIAPAANKYLASLFNTSATRKVVVHAVYVFNWNLTAITGIILEGELKRVTARTAGTGVTAVARDTADSLSSGIACDTASTSVTDSSLLRRVVYSAEETKVGALTLENATSTADPWAVAYKKEQGQKGITLRQNQGITVKNITSSTVGTVSVVIIFTDEPA